jgi:hypothetical protein
MEKESNDGKRKAIPSLLLEQWRLGELNPPRKNKLIEEFGDERIQRELAALEREEDAFLQKLPPLSATENPREQKAATVLPLRRSPWRYAAPLMIAAVALFLLYLPQQKKSTDSFSGDDILLKGDAKPLVVYKQTADGPLPLADGAVVKAGDVIQLVYNAGNFDYGAIISVDAAGQVTWHWPEEPSTMGKLSKGPSTPLKNSFKLDNSPRYERFFFLRSEKPLENLELNPLVDHKDLSQENRLSLPPEIDQFSFLLRK